ncbi:MAG: mandelate racemase [Alphaproteobacteria bacterium]
MPMKLAVGAARFYMRDIRTRLPFRFGAETVNGFPLLHVAVEIACDGAVAAGYAGDNLVPKWFDKDPSKSAERNVNDLLLSAEIAAEVYRAAGETPSLFALWREAYPECQRRAAAVGLNKLTGAFGSALFERAAIDALGRHHRLSLRELLRSDAIGLRPQEIHAGTTPEHVAAWLAATPAQGIALRHTVGMLDPLSDNDLRDGPADDGLPRTLTDYVRRQGLRYFKLKLGGDVIEDLLRLESIASVLDPLIADPYHASLDGNEQYKSVSSLEKLWAYIGKSPKLARLRAALLFLEQPLARRLALDPRDAAGIAAFGRQLPVIIDESDDDPGSFPAALALGYAGVSTKNCKGVIKSFLNRTLVEARKGLGQQVFMSAEDLTNLPIVPLQQDLATVRLLGIAHVERNGHHYVRGLDHCSETEREQAMAHHGDLYERVEAGVALAVHGGMLSVASLETPGYGVAFAPDLAAMTPLETWKKRPAQQTVR